MSGASALATVLLLGVALRASALATGETEPATERPATTPATVVVSPTPSIPGMPDSFRELPEVARAVHEAASAASATTGVAVAVTVDAWAWGDPSLGTYLVLARARTISGDHTVHVSLRDALVAAGAQVSEWRETPADAPTRSSMRFGMRFGSGAVTGRVHTISSPDALSLPQGVLPGSAAATEPADAPSDMFETVAVACLYTERATTESTLLCDRSLSTLLEAEP